MKRINFIKETDENLRKYLEHYCLDVPENDKGDLIRADALPLLIDYQNKLGKDELTLHRVIFHKTGEINQAPYIIVNVGLKRYRIPYDVEVVVDNRLLNVINDAVIEEFKQTPKAKVTGDIDYEVTYKKRFPYTHLEVVSEEGEGMVLPNDDKPQTKQYKK